ncbi:c-type cytochrome [Desertibaculum subflavum]|uniref:c-type cytochrome n=1 Tax=Desertibaculum subflavum TaxID=2268458 RepID=UPI000E66E776
MRPKLAAALILVLGGSAAAAQEAVPPGAAACTGCHAPVARAGAIPALDGRPAAEIAQAMRAFRAGERPATVMDRIAKGFSDEESQAIAAWFSTRK